MRWIALALGLSACAADLGEPRFSVESCHTVALIDAETGDTVVGAEDIALDTNDGVLWVSAYDRLSQSAGGLYRVALSDLSGPSATAPNKIPGFRPHGIEVGGSNLLAFVNRPLTDEQSELYSWTPDADNARDPEGDDRRLTGHSEGHCALNDVAYNPFAADAGDILFGTLDRENCKGGFWERVLQKRTGRVVSLHHPTGVRLDDLSIPNGITYWGDEFWVAEMGQRRLINFDRETIDLPGAPDNLNASEEGIVAALQPSLWRFGLYRYGFWGKAATRIVLVHPDTKTIELLYDDPKGRLLSGATAAVLTDEGTMVASSVRGDRLLVCEAGHG